MPGLVLLVCLAAPALHAATLRLSAESDEIHAGLPFVLSLTAEGFEEEPQPPAPELVIDGASVTFLGVSPNVSSSIQIVNGRRSEWREVTFAYRWRVLPDAPGRYRVPSLTLTQGDESASTALAEFTAAELEASDDMHLALVLPERPVWAGETFDATIEWLLRRDVEGFEFAVPLFARDEVRVEAPDDPGRAFPFPTSTGSVNLPLAQDRISRSGESFTRLSFPARVTVSRPGTIDVGATRVAARLQVGTTRDAFGFRRPRTRLAMAESEPSRLVVRALPQANRPPTFVNAIGAGYAIDVDASRTVVAVGEPIGLTIRIGGGAAVDGLSLPPLDAAGLPAAGFTVLDAPDVGNVDGSAKSFDATVRVTSDEVREIPALAFSWFDPAEGEYRTATSRPIALSVGAGRVVGAADVAVGAPPRPEPGAAAPAPLSETAATSILAGADMTLSDPAQTNAAALPAAVHRTALALLYALPLGLLALRLWSTRTGDRRQRRRQIRSALRQVERALAGAQSVRESAPAAANAMRALARVTGNADQRPEALTRLETLGFDPQASDRPIDEDIARDLRATARKWASAAGSAAVILAAVALAPLADADTGADTYSARDSYTAALDADDPELRRRLFVEAERGFRFLAAAAPDAAELQSDWGNAALGAGDFGRATLAYRRALAIDPGLDRAERNLAVLRDRLPAWLPRPSAAGAIDSLLFWRPHLSVTAQLLLGGFLFALGVGLLAPWPGRGRRAMRGAGAACLLLSVLVNALALTAADSASEAVLVADDVTLHSADSRGAPAVFPAPLPAGTEVSLIERRGEWSRVALADGADGWLASGAIDTVR